MSPIPHSARGFTLVELIAVLVLTGILGAVASSRFIGRESFDIRAYTDQTLATLRFAQKVAITQNRPVFVRLNGASIALCFDAACTVRVLAPGGNSASSETLAACASDKTWYCEAPPAATTYALSPALNASNPYFFFSALGKPYAASDGSTGDGSFATLTLTLQRGGELQKLYVEQDTGYVHQ